MSDTTGSQEPVEPSLLISPRGEAAFSALMDVLVSEEGEQGVPAGGEEAGSAAAGDGPAAPAGEAPAGAPAQPTAPGAGDPGGDGVQAGETGAAEATAPAGTETSTAGETSAQESGGERAPDASRGIGTRDASEFAENWGTVSNALEQRQTETLQRAALVDVRADFGTYFQALEKHPRELVGQKVPRLDGSDGEETLRDAADAQSWQEAVKVQLKREIDARASVKADEVRPMMNTLASSIKLFQQNSDLVPNTKQFDPELATRVTEIAKAFELRLDGKLVGWSVDMQPLVEQERAKLVASRTAAPAAPAPTAQQQRAAEQPRAETGQFSGPQAGITSKAGASAEGQEDFSTLFGTLGLPELRI